MLYGSARIPGQSEACGWAGTDAIVHNPAESTSRRRRLGLRTQASLRNTLPALATVTTFEPQAPPVEVFMGGSLLIGVVAVFWIRVALLQREAFVEYERKVQLEKEKQAEREELKKKLFGP